MQVHDSIHPTSAISIEAGKRIHVDDLQSLLAATKEEMLRGPAAETPRGRAIWRWILALNTIVILAIVAVVVVRRIRRFK
jgi:hypothetical protein